MLKNIFILAFIKLLFLFNLFFHGNLYSNKKFIIWDIGDTLFKADKFKMMQKIGLFDIALYTIFSFKNPYRIQDKIFNIMDDCNYKKYPHPVYSNGKKLPDIMCYWMAGLLSNDEILNIANNKIDEYCKSKKMVDKREIKIVKNIIKNMFDPKILASCMKPIKGVSQLLRRCKKNGFTLVILSNFDSIAFNYIKNDKKNRSIFRYFNPNHIFVSGDIKMLKPSKDIYKYVLDKLKTDPSRCIFIDDQIENIKSALECGIDSILIENYNIKNLESDLKKANII